MKEILHDRRMACAITLVIILASILTGAERSLNQIREPIREILYKGTFLDGESIENDLISRIEYSANLITIAQRYVDGDMTLNFLINSRNELVEASHLYDKYTANQKLSEASSLLYDRVLEENMSERDLKYTEAVYANLKDRNITISYEASVYNERAKEFNRHLSSFPGIIAKSLGMVHPLEIFEGVAN